MSHIDAQGMKLTHTNPKAPSEQGLWDGQGRSCCAADAARRSRAESVHRRHVVEVIDTALTRMGPFFALSPDGTWSVLRTSELS